MSLVGYPYKNHWEGVGLVLFLSMALDCYSCPFFSICPISIIIFWLQWFGFPLSEKNSGKIMIFSKLYNFCPFRTQTTMPTLPIMQLLLGWMKTFWAMPDIRFFNRAPTFPVKWKQNEVVIKRALTWLLVIRVWVSRLHWIQQMIHLQQLPLYHPVNVKHNEIILWLK